MEEHSIEDETREELPEIKTILVVDDDEGWCFLVRKLLERIGFRKKIITAKNGQVAIEKMKTLTVEGERLPEIIFLDVKMPVMDGFEFLEEVTKSGEFDLNRTRIFMCTSSMLAKDKERAYLYPISGIITKPLTPGILSDILL